MKVFLDDITKIDWLVDRINQQKWGNSFLNLKKGFFFVINYNLIENKSSINIVNSNVLFNINDNIYRNMSAEHIGYMQEPFDSSNYLFYSMLKSVCVTSEDEDKLTDLFLSYKSKDLLRNKENLKVIIQGVQKINSNIDFSNALNNIFSINKAPVNGLCMVYDLIDEYVQRVFDKSIYGQMVSSIVKAVKNPNGGLLPEYAGSEMRYLIIGEVAAKDDATLKEAKALLRSGNNPYNIYLETGWYFNNFDSKWRKRISDDTFYFDDTKLVSTRNGQWDFVPKGTTALEQGEIANDLVSMKTDMAKVVSNGYNGRLGDYISFKDAYDLYPNLKDIYSFFSVNTLISGEYKFYFTKQMPYSLVLICGKKLNYDVDKVKYVALHEIQHYVQAIEGFGSGGNSVLAELVSTVGGGVVKMFYISLSQFQNKFSEVASLIPVKDFNNLTDALSKISFNSFRIRYEDRFIDVKDYYNSILKSFRALTQSPNSINSNNTNISYYILSLYSMIKETNGIIEKFVTDFIGAEYINFFKSSLDNTQKTVQKNEKLASLGWSAMDLKILNFQIYESLIGEVEARFTQQTSKIPQELKDYFEFYTSETIDSSKVNVINNSILVDEGKKVEAALETYGENEYVIHLPDSFSNSINLLHETGHILYDFVKDDVLYNHKSLQETILLDYTSIEEYFCASFVDYIHRKNIDPMLTDDLDYEREIKNLTQFDYLFERILYTQSKVDEFGLIDRLGFLNKLLDALHNPNKVETYQVIDASYRPYKSSVMVAYYYVSDSKNIINKNTGKIYRGKQMDNYKFTTKDEAQKFADKLNNESVPKPEEVVKSVPTPDKVENKPEVGMIIDFGDGLEEIKRVVDTDNGKKIIESVRIDNSSNRRNLYELEDWLIAIEKQDEYKKIREQREADELYHIEQNRLKDETEKNKIKDYNDIDGFGEELSAMQKGKVLQYLNKVFYTKSGRVKDYLKKISKGDWYIKPFNGEDKIFYVDGQEYLIDNKYQTKISKDYLNFLKANNK